MRFTITFFYLALHSLVLTSYVYAADQVASQTYPCSWWYGMHGHTFWWIFPFMFFVIMLVIFILMMRKGMGCMWRDRKMCGPIFRDTVNESFGESSESALEILNKRYAKGEIDKKEYEEKKAAISTIPGN